MMLSRAGCSLCAASITSELLERCMLEHFPPPACKLLQGPHNLVRVEICEANGVEVGPSMLHVRL